MTLPSVRSPGLTPAGFGLVAIALVMLVRSLSSRNAYEIVLSGSVLGLCLLCYGMGAWGARRLAGLEPGWKPAVPLTANAAGETLITDLNRPIPWFFRIHFMVKGRFFPAGPGQSCAVQVETSAPRGSNTAALNLNFPMSGIFQGEGYCRLRDMFGFFSFPCGIPQRRSMAVRSAPCLKKNFRIDAHAGAEDQRTKNASDVERYYMREYAPGDRFRDINWKSSDRIDTLITRISPENQEKVSRLEVYFRNFGPTGEGSNSRTSLRDLWLLDRAKARLAQFLWTAKEEQPSYIFHIHTAQQVWDIADQDELENFLEELAALPFSPLRNENQSAPPKLGSPGELYVFSTACDAGLPAFLMARQPLPVFLFFARPGDAQTSADRIERLYIRDFLARGFIPAPQWLSFRAGRLLNPPRLPGARERVPKVSERVPKVSERVSKVSERVSEVRERVSEVRERVSEVSERVSKVSERVSEVSERVSEVRERVSKVSERVSEVSERAPKVRERVLKVREKAPDRVLNPPRLPGSRMEIDYAEVTL